ncbi:MAG: hypothetical protein ABIY50_08215, partial [Ignavibacteria bacterium]
MKKFYHVKLAVIIFIVFFIYSNSFSQLSGTYTIGVGGDYITITSAVSALVTNGVNGPVIFNIKSGRYDESVTLDSIPGTSITNTVTFQSQSGNPDDVVWNTTNTSQAFLLNIRKADNITFTKLSLLDSTLSDRYLRIIVQMSGKIDNLKFIGNKFLQYYFNYNVVSIYANSSTRTTNFIVSQNNFYNNRGLIFEESSLRSPGTQITGNSFQGSYNLRLARHDDLLIQDNNLGAYESILYAGPVSIFLSSCNGNLRIIKNKIKAQSGFHGYGFGISLSGCNCTSSIIANNFAVCSDNGNSINASNCSNLNFYYNSFYCYGQFGSNFKIVNCSNSTVKNNILSGSISSYENSSNSNFSSNYNVFSPYGTYFAYYNGTGYSDISLFRTASNNDFNSRIKLVDFVNVAAGDLHLAPSSIGDTNLRGTPVALVTDDIDGDTRDPNNPTIGADEPPYPTNITVDIGLLIEGFYNSISDYQGSDSV